MNKSIATLSDLLKNDDYRWPQKGDRLFQDSENVDRGVDFPQNEISRYVHIWSGYMSAGAALIDACQRDPTKRHFLIYPILFNYRHSIELAMKWVIERYGRYSTVQIGSIETHDLWDLWKQCKQIIIEVGTEDEAMPVVEQIVKDFHDLDKSALTFRYSRNKNGAQFPLPERAIDLENIRDVMEAIDHFFDGVDGQLHSNSFEY